MSTHSVPWDQHPSAYEHIAAHVRPGVPALAEDGMKLPDDERVNAASKVRFAPGASDGILTHHYGGGGDTEAAERLLAAVRAYADAPTVENKLAAYELLTAGHVISVIDPFMEWLSGSTDVNWVRVYELARSFAMEAPDREPVKWGLAVLGLFARPEDLELLMMLGRHDEFTLYCAVAVATHNDALAHLWELARNAQGWGRVHAVERIAAAETLPEDLKDWLLREGYRNGIMHEYLAHACATAGDLRSAITRPEVDDGLLTAAGEILDALFAGGPAPGIDAYDDAAAVVAAYLRHVVARPAAMLAAFLTARTVREYLADAKTNWEEREAAGWTPGLRASLASACSEFLARPNWPARVADGMRSANPMEFARADAAAGVLAIDTWDVHWARLLASPLDSGRWYHVMRQCDAGRIDGVLALAERSLPLAQIASGPGMEAGLGPGFEPHCCLDYLLQELGRFPGVRGGEPLVRAGLGSPVIRNRNLAAGVLAAWGEPQWPAGMRTELAAARDREPDEQVRRRLENVLAGRPLEDGLSAGQ